MFGDENVTNDHEALLSYIVAAEDEAGEVIYLEVYFGPSGPAIGGSAGENYAKAAEELEKKKKAEEERKKREEAGSIPEDAPASAAPQKPASVIDFAD